MLDRTTDDWTRWLEEFSQGTDREAWRGIMCFLRWIQIRAINGHAIPNFLPGLEGDVFHSHLLRRLLGGKEPLAHPPPESYGGAWYDLLETGKAEGVEVHSWEWAPDVKIAINQGIWSIVEKKNDAEFVVTYREGGEQFRLTRSQDANWVLERASGCGATGLL